MKPKDGELDHITSFGEAAGVKPTVAPYSIPRTKGKNYMPDFQVELSQDGVTWRYFEDGHISHRIIE